MLHVTFQKEAEFLLSDSFSCKAVLFLIEPERLISLLRR